MSNKNDIDWVWVGKLIEAAGSARALGFSVGTTNWGAHLYRAIALQAEQAEPGFVMVPVEPTEAMGLAYLEAAKLHAAEGAEDRMRFSWGGYRAMIAARSTKGTK